MGRRFSMQVRDAIRMADSMMPLSGDVEDLLTNLSRTRDRRISILTAPLTSPLSGLLIATGKADYVVVGDEASPERQVAIVCHEVAHLLLGHDDNQPLSSGLIESGLLQGLNPDLVRSVVAGRHAYAHATELDAETVATHISIQLRRRVMRGGHTYYDELWW
ncbi:hypothetical protein [Brachybacterium sacelli]|uniref:IrrE N-terminal-like domain-containing protein n=1 Tax=Brachybacterium sacelli TaxID=173364 RepID=A0ABS4X2X0_9MICO|nr:hypothetical protein [Brachybacterium sacelli]MBP2382806.1 hypothetical protein [Brachybacterium sacelli]